ncbi:MBG domain-containing protein, partial [Lactobacillus amylovorus]|uniref:MBG domain-containing protein n=3 Tax=Lactobacillus amylovorus TaxID=1604 RepID=UPI003F8B5D44
MLSRNNIHEKLRKMQPQKQRFSIRKFTVGVASVLIGLTFMGINSQTVNAETTDSEEVDATEKNSEQVEKSNDQTLSDVKVQNEANASDSKTVEPKNTDSSTETVSADNNKSLKNDQDNQQLTGKSDSQETKNSSERNESEQQNTSAENVKENDSTPAAEVNKDDSSQRKEEQSPVNSSVKEQQNKDNNSGVAGKNATNIATPKDSNKNIKTDSKKLTPGQVEKSWRVELFAEDKNLNNNATTLPVENPEEYPTKYANNNNLNHLTLYDTNNHSTGETVNLKDMYIYQVAQLNDTNQTAILARKSADDDNVYAFIITPEYNFWGSYYKSSYKAYRINSNNILDLSKGYKIYYNAPGTMEFSGKTINYSGSTLIKGGLYLNGRYQTLQNEYSISNVATGSASTSIGEILPTYQGNKDTYSLVKFYDKNGNLVENDQDAIYVEGWPGQTFTLENVSQYLKVHKGYYLSNQKEIDEHTDHDGNLTGSISDFEVGGYYRKVYYNNKGQISFIGLYHQISSDGKMEVSALKANGEKIGNTQEVEAGKSVKFSIDTQTTWTARNPYVTGSVHAIKYVQLGSVVLYDKTTGDTLKEVQYKNDDSDPASAQLPYSYGQLNDLLSHEGYVLDPEFKESDYELANGQYSQDLRIPYVKQIKVKYSGSDSKTYNGKPAEFNVQNVQSVEWTGLTDLNTSTLTADDFTWNTADHKAPTAAGNYTLSLNANGEAALRAANKNYNIKEISGSYNYTINPAEVKAVTYSGSDSKTYNGKPAEFNVQNVQSVEWTGLTDLNTSTLTADDFTWNTADHKAPTAAGNYTLS